MVGEPQTGKTALCQQLASADGTDFPKNYLMTLLADVKTRFRTASIAI